MRKRIFGLLPALCSLINNASLKGTNNVSGIGFWEITVILLIILILFGTAKLPEIGKALGKAIHEFKKAGKESGEKDEERD